MPYIGPAAPETPARPPIQPYPLSPSPLPAEMETPAQPGNALLFPFVHHVPHYYPSPVKPYHKPEDKPDGGVDPGWAVPVQEGSYIHAYQRRTQQVKAEA